MKMKDVNMYDNNQFNEDQLVMLEQGKELGFDEESIALYTNPNFTWEQMFTIQQGLQEGLTVEQVKTFAEPSISYEEMDQKRKSLMQYNGHAMSKDMLLANSDVRDVLDILKSNGMEKQANDFLTVLSNVDILSHLIENQEKEFQQLRKQISEMQKPSMRERLETMQEAVLDNWNELKNKVDNVKKNIKDGSSFLVETFKTSGKFAFCKAFATFTHGLKEAFHSLGNFNQYNIESNEKTIGNFAAIENEMKSVKTHLLNVGRIIIGKQPKNVEEKHEKDSVLIGSMKSKLKRQNNLLERMNGFLDKCIKKLDSLEKSFSEMSKEHKNKLDDMISSASSKKEVKEQVPVKQKENDITR